MDVRIGILHTAKEIEVELPADADREALTTKIEQALGDDESVLWLTDRHGAVHGVPSGRIGYVQIGRADGERRIGFGA